MAAVIVPRNDEIFKIRGAGVAAGRDLQAGIAPCADDGERQAERGDIQNADVALAVDLAFRHGQLRIQHIIRDKCLLFPLSSGRLGKTFQPGQVGCQAFKYRAAVYLVELLRFASVVPVLSIAVTILCM